MSALIVVAVHARAQFFVDFGSLPETDRSIPVFIVYAITRIGNEAVIVFFVLSGLLVGGRSFERMQDRTFRVLDYAVDRVVRIFLPLVPALVFTAIVCVVIDGNFSVLELLGNLISLQGVFVSPFGSNGPLWSLSYEVWFYFLIYILGVASNNRRIDGSIIFAFVIVAAIFTELNATYLFCWLIGAVSYLALPKELRFKYVVPIILLAAYAVMSIQIKSASNVVLFDELHWAFLTPDAGRILLASCVAMILRQLVFVRPMNVLSQRIDRAGTTLAAFSYTLYLTHYPLLRLINFFGIDPSTKVSGLAVMKYVAVIIVCIAFAYAFHLPFERQTKEVRQWLKRAIGNLRTSERA